MIRTAFSTVACPQWKLERVVRTAAELGYDGVELRTFGYGSRRFVCDPMLTGAAKVASLLADTGVDCCCLATSLRLDAPIRPHLLGRTFLFDQDAPVRRGRRMIDFASRIEAPMVRLFGFEVPAGESRRATVRLIGQRLAQLADHARHRGVRVVVENGGSFRTADDLRELLDAADSPLLGACYNGAVGRAAGEDHTKALRTLGRRLLLARLKDYAQGAPALPGAGEADARGFARALADYRFFDGWLSFEWDAAWHEGLEPADEVLPEAIATIYGWLGGQATGKASPAQRPMAAV